MIIIAMLALGVAQSAAPQEEPSPPEQNSIVVIGRRPADTATALARCLAQRCPAREDVALSLAHAQTQLIAGDYHGSRQTLLAARSRNKGYAKELPTDVGDLHRANARVASLNGLRDASRAGGFDVVDALKAGLPKGDGRILVARLEVGAAFARNGQLRAALDQYDRVARDAHKRGETRVEGLALFQTAALLAAVASEYPPYVRSARAAAAKVERSTTPEWAPFRDAVRVIPAIIGPARDRPRLLDEAVRGMAPRPPGEPFLLYSPAVDFSSQGLTAGDRTEWVDLRYRIAQNGTVADVSTVRSSDGAHRSWIALATEALHGRRYAPQQLGPGEFGPLRTERVSFVSDFTSITRSRIPHRTSRRIDGLDLTGSTEPAAAPAR
jgi:hypothetical protein